MQNLGDSRDEGKDMGELGWIDPQLPRFTISIPVIPDERIMRDMARKVEA